MIAKDLVERLESGAIVPQDPRCLWEAREELASLVEFILGGAV